MSWGTPPQFEALGPNTRGVVTHEGVKIGANATTSDAQIKSTMIHEDEHVDQICDGRAAAPGPGRMVNEIEARAISLRPDNVARSGISEATQQMIAKEIEIRMDWLRDNEPVYYMRVKEQNYQPLPEHLLKVKPAEWMRCSERP